MPIREPFSSRGNYVGRPKEITFREDAPQDLRFVFLETTRALARECRGQYPETEIRDVVAKTLGKWFDPGVWHYQEVWEQIERLVYNCDWFRVYDLIEAVHGYFEKLGPKPAQQFAERINRCFVEQGIGWQLLNGQVVTRGEDAFEQTMETASVELSRRPTARMRLREAIDDLSRRPEADLTGAISHAVAAMECIIGDIELSPEEIRKDRRHTFGSFLKRYPDLFPTDDFKKGFEGLWNYANNEGSRHGKEGVEPGRDEAELIVGLAAALVTYLNRKSPR